ncbi:HugZ family protein [Magnetospira sp. QH-2]|uniref:HugZ family pyridoxamine 5'-phosphate oxidase n=1 Tax=Magnetospira sp. (strain QH-2) TaxID=1288970 RepID=UPI0003E80EAF|nr:pyridoxamine 5'-phosphate oxidase family protein [Magnetospira sp. QH-2]CCQ75013.1 protein of unknown function[Include Pyridoxamine 5'-phosphate oxidase domain] [Magnetospira sp. QH-2]
MKEPPIIEITDDHISGVKALLADGSVGTLATLDTTGAPYASLATFAMDDDYCPILLLSDLADHTRNMVRDPRVSLLVEQAKHLKNPQTGPRVSIGGRIEKADDPAAKERFLSTHPTAAVYADFGDFNCYRLIPVTFHFVGGFGSAVWIGADRLFG